MMMILVYFKSTTWITTRTEARPPYVDPDTPSSHFSSLGSSPKLIYTYIIKGLS